MKIFESSYVDRKLRVGVKNMEDNLQAITEGGNFQKVFFWLQIYPKNLLVDCTFINSMLKSSLEHPSGSYPLHYNMVKHG